METAPRNCRFLSLVVVERVLRNNDVRNFVSKLFSVIKGTRKVISFEKQKILLGGGAGIGNRAVRERDSTPPSPKFLEKCHANISQGGPPPKLLEKTQKILNFLKTLFSVFTGRNLGWAILGFSRNVQFRGFGSLSLAA